MTTLIIMDKQTELYKSINYLNGYSLINQDLLVNEITIFNIENIRESYGIYIENSKIKFTQNGIYNINCSLNIGVTSANQVAEIFYFLRMNNDDIIGSGGRLSLLSGNTKYSCHYNQIIRINNFETDYIEFVGFSSIQNVYISKENTKFDNPDIPITPSINISIVSIV